MSAYKIEGLDDYEMNDYPMTIEDIFEALEKLNVHVERDGDVVSFIDVDDGQVMQIPQMDHNSSEKTYVTNIPISKLWWGAKIEGQNKEILFGILEHPQFNNSRDSESTILHDIYVTQNGVTCCAVLSYNQIPDLRFRLRRADGTSSGLYFDGPSTIVVEGEELKDRYDYEYIGTFCVKTGESIGMKDDRNITDFYTFETLYPLIQIMGRYYGKKYPYLLETTECIRHFTEGNKKE